MSAPRPHVWPALGHWWCAVVQRTHDGLPRRNDGALIPEPDTAVCMGGSPYEAHTAWRLVTHGRRHREVATASPAR